MSSVEQASKFVTWYLIHRPRASILEMVDRLHKKYSEAAKYDTAPVDFAKNRKHHMYGFPKEDD